MPNSLQGHFLIATPQLMDRNFVRAVVLIVRHDADGALGLIINRPLEAQLSSIWEQISQVPCILPASLHQGGPCEGPLMVLHGEMISADEAVTEGVAFTADQEMIEQLVSQGASNVIFVVGYAGWSAGQLEAELGQGSWMVMPASSGLVFGAKDKLWEVLFRKVHRAKMFPWLDPRRIPDDPTVN